MRRYHIIIALLFLGYSITAQQITPSEYGTFLLENATIHTITNGELQGDILISNGIIDAVGADVQPPEDATVIDCSGKHIYPGFIDGGTQVGLYEVGSVPLTVDYQEIGEITPQMQALTAVNPNSAVIPVTRVSGVTTVLTMPSRGLFPGTASLIHLHGYTPQQMYAGFQAVRMSFPSSGRRGFWDRRTDEEVEKESKKAFETLNDLWKKLEVYDQIDLNGAQNDYNPALARMLPLYRNEEILLIEVNKKDDILKAIDWVQEKDIQAVLTGVAEGWRVAEDIAAADIPVIAGPVLTMPTRSSDRYDKAYANAGLMKEKGVKLALRTNDAENARNLPFHAGFAAAYGLGVEDALEAITIVPAEIFGVADRLGSIEEGKSATVFVCDGDPFEPKTQISHLFIDGWQVAVESRQTYLYDEFLQRSPGVKE